MADVEAHNRRVALGKLPKIDTAASLLAESRERVTQKKASTLVKANRKLESVIQEEIESYLRSICHIAWWDRKRMDMATTSRKGVPDFVGCIMVSDMISKRTYGVPFGLEVKRSGEKPTTDQLGELAWMRKAGARTAVVFSKEEAVEFFNSIIKP
jgi:hypothetical protein